MFLSHGQTEAMGFGEGDRRGITASQQGMCHQHDLLLLVLTLVTWLMGCLSRFSSVKLAFSPLPHTILFLCIRFHFSFLLDKVRAVLYIAQETNGPQTLMSHIKGRFEALFPVLSRFHQFQNAFFFGDPALPTPIPPTQQWKVFLLCSFTSRSSGRKTLGLAGPPHRLP